MVSTVAIFPSAELGESLVVGQLSRLAQGLAVALAAAVADAIDGYAPGFRLISLRLNSGSDSLFCPLFVRFDWGLFHCRICGAHRRIS